MKLSSGILLKGEFMERKYIDLLLKKCIDLNKSKILFINYDIINQDFIDKLVVRAKELGVIEIYLDKDNIYDERDILKTIELDKIDNHPYFNRAIWNEYAEKGSNFLIFRAPNPGVMNEVDPKKVARAEFVKRNTSSIYKKMQLTYQIPWCIAALPNRFWAKNIFGDVDNSLELLENALYKVCMVDTFDPIESWNDYLENNKAMLEKLNSLKIKMLHYKNSLGTDLTLELLDDNIWCNASKNGLVNMPSYEIFTTPDYRKTNGIVYSSRPLIYNGALIDNFWIKFEDGKAIDCGAKEGEEVLKSIINSDSNSCYLGECALVENDSPISNTGLVFGLTLMDENASCHLALGEGLVECSKGNENLSDEELLQKGINLSKVHVDFMIGTSDLEIIAETKEHKKVKIMKNGNFRRF